MTAPLAPDTPAAELVKLAYSPERGVRQQVAAHPNTPAAVLGQLGAEFPSEVLHNPALPLLRLAQPGLMAGWRPRTLEAMTAQPDAPEWLLRLAATHSIIDVQLACVTHPALSADVLSSLAQSPFWTIREYVARKPKLPPELLETLANDLDYGVRITVAGREDLPPGPLKKLQHDTHPLVRAVLKLHEHEEAGAGAQ